MLGLIDAKPKVGYFLGANMSPAVERIKRLQTMQVKEVQGIPFIIRENVSVQDAVVSLFIENIGSLIVTNNEEELTGIVSRKDLLKVSVGNANSAAMPVSLVMTRHPNIVTVGPEDNVLIAAQKMIKHDVDGLPVVDRNEEGKPVVVGRITKTTMTKVLLELAGS